MTDRSGRIQTLGTHADTIHDSTAAEYTEGVIQFGQAFLSRRIPAIVEESVGLQQTRGTDDFLRVPPERGALAAAGAAHDALVGTV